MCTPAHTVAVKHKCIQLSTSSPSSSQPNSPRQMERLKADMDGLQREGGGIESSLTYETGHGGRVDNLAVSLTQHHSTCCLKARIPGKETH